MLGPVSQQSHLPGSRFFHLDEEAVVTPPYLVMYLVCGDFGENLGGSVPRVSVNDGVKMVKI